MRFNELINDFELKLIKTNKFVNESNRCYETRFYRVEINLKPTNMQIDKLIDELELNELDFKFVNEPNRPSETRVYRVEGAGQRA